MGLNRFSSIYFSGQFGKFLLAGGLAAVVNFVSRFAFEPLLGFYGAVAAAYGAGFAVAFLLNRRFVFPASGRPVRHELLWFLFFNALAFPVVVTATILLDAFIFRRVFQAALSEAVAHAIAIMLPVLFNFAAHKFVTFDQKRI